MKHRMAVIVSIVLLSASAQAIGGDYPQWRGANRDGKSSDTGLLKQWPDGGPKLLWSVDGLGKGYSTVAVANGLIYTTGLSGANGVLFAWFKVRPTLPEILYRRRRAQSTVNRKRTAVDLLDL